MNRKFIALIVGVAVGLSAQISSAMPTLDLPDEQSASVDELIKQQGASVKSGDNAAALAANTKLGRQIAKLAESMPYHSAMVLYDRAIILDRLGRRSDAVDLMNTAYTAGQLDQLSDAATLPIDYYGTAMKTYVDWLREIEGSNWREVQDHFVQTLNSLEIAKNRIEIASWVGDAMLIRKDEGDLEVAQNLCEQQTAWFNKLDLNYSRSFYFGRPTVFVDDARTFVTGLAIRTGEFDQNYHYVHADMLDSCGSVYEASDELEMALVYRSRALEVITEKGPKQFLPLVTLRLGRLFAYANDAQQSAKLLGQSIDGYLAQMGEQRGGAAFCENLSFTLEGREVSNLQVWGKLLGTPETAAAVARVDCGATYETTVTSISS